MNQDELLAQLKKDVRSLLISSKLGVEARRLHGDYASMLGHPMPLKQLGFRNVMDMVKEMPDVVTINFRADGNVWLTAVGDESTRNIEELVASQRMPKPKKITMQPRKIHYSSRPFFLRPIVALPRRGGVPVAVPADLRAQLHLLLCQGPILTSNLESCFLRRFGYPLRPQNYGFYSTGEMLEAAKDMIWKHQTKMGSAVSLRQHKVASELAVPFMSKKNTGQIKSAPVSADRSTHKMDTGPAITVKTQAQAPAKQSPGKQPSTCKTTESALETLKTVTSEQKKGKESQGEPEVCTNNGLYQKQVLKLEEELRQKIIENGVAATVSQELKDKLRMVVHESTDGISVHSLPAEYKRLFGEDLPLQQNGFVSATEMVGAMVDTFHLTPVNDDSGQHWRVVDILSSDVRQSDPKGASSLDGPSARDDFIYSQSSSNSKPDDASVCESTNCVKTPEIAYCKGTVVPLDAVQSQRLDKPRRLGPREFVEVQVEEVVSPGHFYVSFSNSEEAQALDNMMLEMRRCYKCPEVSHPYRLTEPFVRRGQVCCVSPVGLWFYRAVIHRITSPSEVEVYFVDYGSRAVVPITSLKFLKSCYSVLPAQAVLSSLAGIKPAGGWSAEATASFQKLCCSHPLVGATNGYAGDVLLLYLCNTRTDDDVYVHSVLLNQGHGTACSPLVIPPLFVNANPVSLYLGQGMIDLPEIEEESFPNPNESPVAFMKAHLMSGPIDDEMPGLELIEDVEISCHNQGSSLLDLSLPDAAFAHSRSDEASTTESHMTNPPSPSPIFISDPDLIQSEADAARTSALDAMTTPSPAPSSATAAASSPTPGEGQQQLMAVVPCSISTPPAVTTLSLNTSDFAQCFPGSPLKLRKSGCPFPLFGTMHFLSSAQTKPASWMSE